MRDVDGRIRWALNNKPTGPGRCAEHLWHALGGPADPPRQGLPDATSVANLVRDLGHMQTGPCPRGAVRYWVGGSQGHGHVAIETADLLEKARVVSVDVKGPGTVGEVSLDWIAKNWPKLRYVGWSWWWGRFDTKPGVTPPPEPPEVEEGPGLWSWYSGKPRGEQVVYPDGKWNHLPGLDEPASGITAESTEWRMLYLRLEFTETRTADRVVETRFVRAGGDARKAPTAYDAETFGTVKDSYPYQNVHFEDGDGKGGKWQVKVTGGKDPVTITTRYAKQHTVYVVD